VWRLGRSSCRTASSQSGRHPPWRSVNMVAKERTWRVRAFSSGQWAPTVLRRSCSVSERVAAHHHDDPTPHPQDPPHQPVDQEARLGPETDHRVRRSRRRLSRPNPRSPSRRLMKSRTPAIPRPIHCSRRGAELVRSSTVSPPAVFTAEPAAVIRNSPPQGIRCHRAESDSEFGLRNTY
jgi:hypothetical protein